VLDFGLARGVVSSGLTLHGMVIGTTHYMAPEQALGQFDRIGRRTDVYGLGATLYKLFTGKLLFEGMACLESLRTSVEAEPVRPRNWIPHLPKELETIVLKCLEKDPERRYESALAVAEDLRRYREGQPILAHPATWTYRAGKFARKHRWLVGTSGLASMLVLALGSWGFAMSARARKISGFAASFGAQAESLSAVMRMSYLLPQHDIRPQKDLVRRRMENLRQAIRAEGSLAEGPGAYALGQGHLALREFPQARRELERAWNAGYQSPQVALALGQALGELYREGREELLQIKDPEQREERGRDLARQYRDPALAYLHKVSVDTPEMQTYLEGLLAFHEANYPAAIAKAREAFRQDPGFYEAKLLEGNALVAMGMALQDRDPSAFIRHLQEAGGAFAVALNMGRSDPALLLAEGERRCELAKYAFFYSEKPLDNHLEIQGYLDQVLVVDPDAAQVYLAKSRLAGAYASFLGDHGRDPSPLLDQAITWCGQAAKLSNGELPIASSVGDLYRWRALYQRDRGLDASDSLEQACTALQEAISLRPADAWAHQRLAEVWEMRSEIAIERGKDPQDLLNQGLTHIQEALRTSATSSCAMTAATLTTDLGDWQQDQGEDPEPSYLQALKYYHLASERSPEDGDIQAGVADIAVRYASYLRRIGKPVDDILGQGLEASARAISISPTYLHFLNQGDCLRVAAQVRLDRGEDATPLIHRAEDSLNQAERINAGGDYTLFWCQGMLAMVAGQAELAQHRCPEEAWSKAECQLAKAARMSPNCLDVLVSRARLARLRGEWGRLRSGASGDVVRDGLEATAEGLRLKSRQPELQALQGCLFKLQAEATTYPALRLRLLEQAQRDLIAAFSENGFLSREFTPELETVKAQLARPMASLVQTP
jgi:serine/threonine-protein kinase